MITSNKITPVNDIYNHVKTCFKLALNNVKDKNQFNLYIGDLVDYTDYDGDYKAHDGFGKCIGYNKNNCNKNSPFWQALWKFEKDLEQEYKINFNEIWFSFCYQGQIHFTKI